MNEDTGRVYALAAVVIVALAVGFGAGHFLAGGPGSSATSFSDTDRNFLVNVANSQIDLTTARLAAAVDWCVANGGTWNLTQQQGTVSVNAEVAAQLEKQGADVTKDVNGNYVAKVLVAARDTCIFPLKKAA